MDAKDFADLRAGDIVTGKLSGLAFVITGRVNGVIVAVRTTSVESPEDWTLVKKGEG